MDALLVSHGHADHVGSLDWLDHLGRPPVHANAPVRALSVHRALKSARGLASHQVVAGSGVEVGPAGHAPGAVWMRIGGKDGLVYWGNLCREGGLFSAGPLPRVRAAFLDTSCGAEAGVLVEQRAALIATAAAGPCLLPVPPEGRGMELALALIEAGHEVAICDALRHAATVMPGFSEWLAPQGAGRLRVLLRGAAYASAEGPLDRITLAAGANCGSGLLKSLDPRAQSECVPVILTGHRSAGPPAANWVAGGKARQLRWNVHPDLGTTPAMLAETTAATVMPAFSGPDRRLALAAALPAPWSASGRIAW